MPDTYRLSGPCWCCCTCATLDQFIASGLSVTFSGGISACPIDGQTYALTYVTTPPTDFNATSGIPRCAHDFGGGVKGWKYENAGPTITIWLPQSGLEGITSGGNTGLIVQCNKLYVHVRQSGVFPDCCAGGTFTFDNCTDGAVSMTGTVTFPNESSGGICTGNCSGNAYPFTITG